MISASLSADQISLCNVRLGCPDSRLILPQHLCFLFQALCLVLWLYTPCFFPQLFEDGMMLLHDNMSTI